jgi:hypothetical protein
MAVRLSALCAGRFLPPGRLLVLISVRRRVDPRKKLIADGKININSDHRGRALRSWPPRTLRSWFRVSLKAWMSVCAFILYVGSGLAKADPPSKQSYVGLRD